MIARIRYLKNLKRQSAPADIGGFSDLQIEESEEKASSCLDDLEFLKVAVVTKENMDIIKTKLRLTSEYRRKLIQGNHTIDLLEMFPYFFHNSELVI